MRSSDESPEIFEILPNPVQFLEPGDDYLKTFEDSRVVIIPAGLEQTTSYMKGTAKGPSAILEASVQVELYDEELNDEAVELGIFTLAELDFSNKTQEESLDLIGIAFKTCLDAGKFVVSLGGEHSVTIPVIRELKEVYPDLVVLSFDAHGDLRISYHGEFSHACVMRRISEMDVPVYVIGVRSICREEADFIASNPKVEVLFDYERADRKFDAIELLKWGKHVYVTVDLDAFDPAEMPAVGTPEPGGLHWREFWSIFQDVCEKTKIVGLDVVELMPRPGQERADFYSARLLYKMLGFLRRSGQLAK